MSGDQTSIFLRDCRVQLRVGLYEHEQMAAQLVIINVEAETSLGVHFDDRSEKSIARVVSYETIYNYIHDELATMGHIYLLETAAESLIAFCFRDARVKKVTVRLEKPNIFAGAIPGIAMTRVRPQGI